MYARILAAAAAVLCLLFLSTMQVAAAEPEGWNRTGFYVGAVGGYSLDEIKAEDFKMSDGSLFGGPFGGFNWRVNPGLVAGVEVDYLFMNVKASKTDEGFTVTATNNFLASVRGRVGVPIGPALLYGTGGLALTEKKLAATDGMLSLSDKELSYGVVGGGGVEAELTKTLFVRLEALHYWFPDEKMSFDSEAFKSGQHTTIIRGGLGFKLN